MSERRACRVIGCCQMTMRYEAIRQDDPVLRERLKELAWVRRRFGCRRLHVFLRREGHEVNHKSLFRIYREERLHVRRRGGRKRAIGTRAPMALPLMPNQRWSLGPRHVRSDQWRFHGSMSDQLTDARRFRVLTVVDDCTRECLGPDRRHVPVRRKSGTGVDDTVRGARKAQNCGQRQQDQVHLERDPHLRG